MWTTPVPDEELLRTAKAIAAARRETLSTVSTRLAGEGVEPERQARGMRYGFVLLPHRSETKTVTSEHVAELLNRADFDDLGAVEV